MNIPYPFLPMQAGLLLEVGVARKIGTNQQFHIDVPNNFKNEESPIWWEGILSS